MTEILFDHNLLNFIDSSALSSLPLTYLILSNNQLESISFITFPSSLSYLIANDNVITSLSALHFTDPDSNSLEELRLFNNPISNISTDAFSSLTKLQTLDLLNTSVSSFDNVKFPPSLTGLTLSNNTKLTSIEGIGLYRCLQLTVLQLANTAITDIFNYVLPSSLIYLDLSNTQLTRLPQALSTLTHLEHLDLRDVHTLNCTCDLALESWYQKNIVGKNIIVGRCSSGEDITQFLGKCWTT